MWNVVLNGSNVYVYHSKDKLRWLWFTDDEFKEWILKNENQVEEIVGYSKKEVTDVKSNS